MFDREVLFAVALLSSILTAIPIVLLALLAGPRQSRATQPQMEEPAKEPEAKDTWRPLYYGDQWHWEPGEDSEDPYSWRRVRNVDEWETEYD